MVSIEPYQRLESEFGRWAGVDNVVACNSGTAALHLALEALQLPLGSKVACPDFTMVSCARAIALAGHEPVFIDCRDGDLTMDVNALDEACSQFDGIRAVMPVAVYGRACAMDEIAEIATKYDLYVIEDLAEAHGLEPHQDTDAACWSFYRNKVIAGEEGGAVAFQSPDAAKHARQLRCLGFTAEHDFYHVPRGCNYRLANSLAEQVLASLANVDSNLLQRRQIESWYNEYCPDEWRMPPRDVPWVYDVRIRGLSTHRQRRIVRALHDAGIAARHGFKPMSCQKEFWKCGIVGRALAFRLADEVFYLPLTPGITQADCRRAFAVIASVA